ncbi:MAG: pilus assembly protein [Anaerolineaceae bacterium 4572_5.1]|nr:MAG: pilus assembly protein [Anaerolineaceae bacterium 4572_5.1]
MIVCDTNILIEFYKNNSQILQTLHKIGQEHLAISIITQAELYFGALNNAELLKIKRHLSLLQCYPIGNHLSDTFLQLMESYSLSHKLSIPDALIAATALTHGAKLYTLNIKDFRFIPGLVLYE